MRRSLAAAMSLAQDDALCHGTEDVAAEVAAVRAVVVVSSRHRCCVVRGSATSTQRLQTRWRDNVKRCGALGIVTPPRTMSAVVACLLTSSGHNTGVFLQRLLPRSPLPLRPPPPRSPCRRVHSRVYSDRVVAALVAIVALATVPRSLLPRACLRRCAATLSIVVPPCQQFPCAHAATSGIIAPPRVLADAVAPPRLALSRHRVRSR